QRYGRVLEGRGRMLGQQLPRALVSDQPGRAVEVHERREVDVTYDLLQALGIGLTSVDRAQDGRARIGRDGRYPQPRLLERAQGAHLSETTCATSAQRQTDGTVRRRSSRMCHDRTVGLQDEVCKMRSRPK